MNSLVSFKMQKENQSKSNFSLAILFINAFNPRPEGAEFFIYAFVSTVDLDNIPNRLPATSETADAGGQDAVRPTRRVGNRTERIHRLLLSYG